jgi:hypothetical protein
VEGRRERAIWTEDGETAVQECRGQVSGMVSSENERRVGVLFEMLEEWAGQDNDDREGRKTVDGAVCECE